jgi:hypothetical protein
MTPDNCTPQDPGLLGAERSITRPFTHVCRVRPVQFTRCASSAVIALRSWAPWALAVRAVTSFRIAAERYVLRSAPMPAPPAGSPPGRRRDRAEVALRCDA